MCNRRAIYSLEKFTYIPISRPPVTKPSQLPPCCRRGRDIGQSSFAQRPPSMASSPRIFPNRWILLAAGWATSRWPSSCYPCCSTCSFQRLCGSKQRVNAHFFFFTWYTQVFQDLKKKLTWRNVERRISKRRNWLDSICWASTAEQAIDNFGLDWGGRKITKRTKLIK